jgi:hypothetical protein
LGLGVFRDHVIKNVEAEFFKLRSLVFVLISSFPDVHRKRPDEIMSVAAKRDARVFTSQKVDFTPPFKK